MLFLTVAAICGLEARSKENKEPPSRLDFTFAAVLGLGLLPYILFRLASNLLPLDEPKSVLDLLFVSAAAAGLVVFAAWLQEHATEKATTVVYQVATRQISWWSWLPENGAKEKFCPIWSTFLAAFVFVAAPLLILGVARKVL